MYALTASAYQFLLITCDSLAMSLQGLAHLVSMYTKYTFLESVQLQLISPMNLVLITCDLDLNFGNKVTMAWSAYARFTV